jgi:hypothetical protein
VTLTNILPLKCTRLSKWIVTELPIKSISGGMAKQSKN